MYKYIVIFWVVIFYFFLSQSVSLADNWTSCPVGEYCSGYQRCPTDNCKVDNVHQCINRGYSQIPYPCLIPPKPPLCYQLGGYCSGGFACSSNTITNPGAILGCSQDFCCLPNNQSACTAANGTCVDGDLQACPPRNQHTKTSQTELDCKGNSLICCQAPTPTQAQPKGSCPNPNISSVMFYPPLIDGFGDYNQIITASVNATSGNYKRIDWSLKLLDDKNNIIKYVKSGYDSNKFTFSLSNYGLTFKKNSIYTYLVTFNAWNQCSSYPSSGKAYLQYQKTTTEPTACKLKFWNWCF